MMSPKTERLPILIVVTGIPGAGKTWLADLLSANYSISHIDYDAVCQPFLRTIRRKYEGDFELEDFHREWRREAYQALMEVVIQNLRNNVSVITSAPFSKEISDKNYFSNLKSHYKIEFIATSLHLILSKERVLQNIKKRGDSRDQDKIQFWDSFYEEKVKKSVVWDADYYYEPNLEAQLSPLLQIDNFLTKNNLILR